MENQVLSMEAFRVKRNKPTKESQVRDALIHSMTASANVAMNNGASFEDVIGACGAIMAEAIANYDPTLEKHHVRELIFTCIGKVADEILLQQWENYGRANSDK